MSLPNNYEVEGQLSIFDIFSPDTWSGRTYQEPLVQTKEKTSGRSLKKQQKSAIKMPLFLDLRTENGHQAAVSWVMGGPLLGDYMMRSFGECPSVENVSLLSQILEDNPHPKYCLSPKACQGILRRAEKRGKKLPELLEKTLIKQSAFKNELGNQGGARESSFSMSEQEPCQHLTTNTYCIEGHIIDRETEQNGRGWKEEESYTLNSVDRHGVCYGTAYDGSQVSPTLTANNANGAQRMPDKENFNAVITYGVDCYNQTQSKEVTKSLNAAATDSDHIPCVYGLDRASFNQGQNAQYDFSIEEETAQTLVSRGPGGGTEQTVGALCARDYKGVGNQYVNEGKLIVQSDRNTWQR